MAGPDHSGEGDKPPSPPPPPRTARQIIADDKAEAKKKRKLAAKSDRNYQPTEENPNGATGPKGITEQKIALRLRRFYGNVTDVADNLKVDARGLLRRIEASAFLLEVMQDCRQGFLDLAKSKWVEKVKAGEWSAINKVLDTYGKGEGFGIQRHEHTGKDGAPVEHNVTSADVTDKLTEEELDAARRRFVVPGDHTRAEGG